MSDTSGVPPAGIVSTAIAAVGFNRWVIICAPRIRDLYIDFGFDTAEQVEAAGIRVGDPVVKV